MIINYTKTMRFRDFRDSPYSPYLGNGFNPLVKSGGEQLCVSLCYDCHLLVIMFLYAIKYLK